MTTNSVVFISNKSKEHDYSKAEEYGVIRAITSGNYAFFKTIRLRDEIVATLVYSKQEDYLLLSGSSVIAGMCMSIWLMQHETVNMLLYDRKVRKYVKREFSRKEAMLEIERERDRVDAQTSSQTD